MEPCVTTIYTLLWVQVTVWGEVNDQTGSALSVSALRCERKLSTSKFAHKFNDVTVVEASINIFDGHILRGDFLAFVKWSANTISPHRK